MVRDPDAVSPNEHNLEVERTPSTVHIPVVDGTKASETVHSIEAKQEDEGTEKKEMESLPVSEQDGERMGLDIKGDSSPETGDENKQDSNRNHSERDKVLSFDVDPEEHSIHPEELNEPDSEIKDKCL